MIAARSAPPALLSFRAVAKSFGDTRAIDEVTFDVPRGEFCVLLGRSGAGKSTLLRAVNGLTDVSAGEIVFDGATIDRRNQRAVCQRVAMIHQQFNLVLRASVAVNVMSGALAATPLWRTLLHWYPVQRREKCWSLVQRVGLDGEQLFRRAQDLSGGQQQRVGIARAFMLDPELILADEPVASLDPKVSRDILALLRDAAKERGATVLCSLHQLDLAREFGDRIVGIDSGRVIFDGAPGQLNSDVIERLYGTHVTPLHGAPVNSPRPLPSDRFQPLQAIS